jgi:ATP-dependent Lon protease
MKYPVLATRGIITFPKHKSTFEVGRKSSLSALSISTIQNNKKVVLVAQKDINIDNVTKANELFKVGTLVNFKVLETFDSGTKKIEVEGIKRVKISKFIFDNEFISAETIALKEINGDENSEQAFVRKISDQIDSALGSLVEMPKHVLRELAAGISAGELADVVGHYMPLTISKKQKMLSEPDINKRLEIVVKELDQESKIKELEKGIDNTVRKTLDNQQREFLLRERLKAIKEELGDISSQDSYVDEIRKKLQSDKFPKIVKTTMLEELKKYESMPSISAEANVSKSYMD